jgi:hemoglobin
MSATVTEVRPASPYEAVGGRDGVRLFVDRFYDLMASDPRYAALRALHAPDLTPMRASLAGFLSAWLGGPRDWFDERPGACIMSAHARIQINAETARQWTEVMAQALADSAVDPELATRMNEAFARMAEGMTRR